MILLCEVFKSSRKQEMYLYVERSQGLENVPASLLEQFGEPIPVLILQLTPERHLARVEAAAVLAGIAERGFYLQLPPSASELLARERGHA